MESKYCMQCGQESLTFENNRKFHCSQCDFVLYHNCAAAVAVLIFCKDQLLFARRNREPKKGLLDLPGGFCDPNETAEHTCSRELQEELGWVISPSNFRYLGSRPNLYSYRGVTYHTMDLFYTCEIEEQPETTLELSELSAIEWKHLNELDLNELAFESQKAFLKEHFSIK